MSLKPKKHSDQKKIQAKMKQHESKMATKYQLPPYTLIVSEGIRQSLCIWKVLFVKYASIQRIGKR